MSDQEREALEAVEAVLASPKADATRVGLVTVIDSALRLVRAALAACEEPQPSIAEREQHQYELGFNRGQAAARVSLIPGDHPETRKLAEMMREDTERPDAICGVVCAGGPNGEPMACGYGKDHEGAHSWASLPTWTDRWRIVHHPHKDSKKSSMAIEGPPTDSRVVYGVAMDRGVLAHERAVRDTEQEHEG